MERASAFFVLFLYYSLLPGGAGSCNMYGPGNCAFQTLIWRRSTFCSWKPDAGVSLYYYQGYSGDFFPGFADNTYEGNLRSRTVCHTVGRTHCLSFWYRFEDNNVLNLSVSIKNEGGLETELWTTSWSDGWNYAMVPIQTMSNFRIFYTARRSNNRPSSSPLVFIDDIYYEKIHCSVYPSHAKPRPAVTIGTASTLSMVSTATDDAKNLTSATTTAPNGLGTPNPKTFHSNATIQRAPNQDTSTKPENKVGIIVGVIVAVLIVIVIAVGVLLVVLKRKHIQVCKACCREKQPKEQLQMNAADNAAYSLEVYDARYANEAKNHHGRQNSDNHGLQAGASTQASVTPCYENQPSKPPSAPAYAEVSKRRKDAEEPQPYNQRNPSTTVYEICSVDEMNPTNAAGREHKDLSPKVTDQGSGGHSHYSVPAPTASGGFSSAQNSHGIYHTLEKESDKDNTRNTANSATSASPKGPDGEYKSLDFDKKSWGAGGNTGGAAGAVYTHLNAGGEDTYNEVHRDKKEKVIDGVYSHIK